MKKTIHFSHFNSEQDLDYIALITKNGYIGLLQVTIFCANANEISLHLNLLQAQTADKHGFSLTSDKYKNMNTKHPECKNP